MNLKAVEVWEPSLTDGTEESEHDEDTGPRNG